MRILGIHDGHNTSVALAQDGVPRAAVDEERCRRRKNFDSRRHAWGMPREALASVLRLSRQSPGDIDAVAVAMASADEDRARFGRLGHRWRGARRGLAAYLAHKAWRRAKIRAFLRAAGIDAPLVFVHHHMAHAASAWMTSGFDSGVAVTLDGKGDLLCGMTVRFGPDGARTLDEVDQLDSPAMVYSAVTAHLGFRPDEDEGKVTALAASGRPHPGLLDALGSVIGWSEDRLRGHGLRTLRGPATFLLQPSGALRRTLADRLPDAAPADVAFAVQRLLERLVVAHVREALRRADADSLALAGGVFANVTLNRVLAELPEVRRLFVHPAMGDSGLALGAALHAGHVLDGWAGAPLQTVALGDDIPTTDAVNPTEVADRIAAGDLVAVARGRMEYGPRALGQRSILARPDRPELGAELNRRLGRDGVMPFAPMMLADEPGLELRDADVRLRPFMTGSWHASEALAEQAPGVVHVDGTCRAQFVGDEQPWLQAVLRAVRERIGLGMVLNTSFNRHREPIVRTAADARAAFEGAGLDALVLGDALIRR